MYSRDCVQFDVDYKQKKASTVLENKYGWFGIALNSEKEIPVQWKYLHYLYCCVRHIILVNLTGN
jgi:hypothetical protein